MMHPWAGLVNGNLHKLFEAWLGTDLKAQVAHFYRANPGVVETMEGLALRLGVSAASLHEAVADHLRLGLLRERRADGKVLVLYDPARHRHLETSIQAWLRTPA